MWVLRNPRDFAALIRDDAVDYNSWQESEKGLRLASSLDKDTVIVEGMFEPGTLQLNLFVVLRLISYRLQGIQHR